MIRGTWTVLKKELKDHARDRRSLFTALLMPLLGPAMLLGMFTLVASWADRERPLRIPVVGADQVPTLVTFLKRSRAEVAIAPDDYEAQVRDGKLDVVLVVPEDYARDFAAGRTATVQLVFDNSRNKARAVIVRTRALVQEYSRQTGALRLIARGISPELARPVRVEDLDLATTEKTAATVLGIFPMFVLMAVIMGGMNVAVDVTAGERERGSLEPLLLNPVPPAAIVTGKWLTAVLVSLLALAVNLAGSKLAIARVPLQDLGLRAHLGTTEIAGIVMAVLPLAILAPAVQMLLAVFSRSYKEAQTYLNIIMLLPLAPGVIASLSPFRHALWMMAVPSLAQTLLMEQVMRGEFPSALWFLAAWTAGLVFAGLCIAATVRLMQSERIVFGR